MLKKVQKKFKNYLIKVSILCHVMGERNRMVTKRCPVGASVEGKRHKISCSAVKYSKTLYGMIVMIMRVLSII